MKTQEIKNKAVLINEIPLSVIFTIIENEVKAIKAIYTGNKQDGRNFEMMYNKEEDTFFGTSSHMPTNLQSELANKIKIILKSGIDEFKDERIESKNI